MSILVTLQTSCALQQSRGGGTCPERAVSRLRWSTPGLQLRAVSAWLWPGSVSFSLPRQSLLSDHCGCLPLSPGLVTEALLQTTRHRWTAECRAGRSKWTKRQLKENLLFLSSHFTFDILILESSLLCSMLLKPHLACSIIAGIAVRVPPVSPLAAGHRQLVSSRLSAKIRIVRHVGNVSRADRHSSWHTGRTLTGL